MATPAYAPAKDDLSDAVEAVSIDDAATLVRINNKIDELQARLSEAYATARRHRDGQLTPALSRAAEGGVRNSETNQSGDPALRNISFGTSRVAHGSGLTRWVSGQS